MELDRNLKLLSTKFYKKIVIIFTLLSFTLNQRCQEGFFWCGGNFCYNSTMYDGCCAKEGINSKLYECCFESEYNAWTCEKPKKCCSRNNYCYLESNQTCCNHNFVCSKETEQCCEEICCGKEESCCKNKCCPFGYKCNDSLKFATVCELIFDYRFFGIPILINISGFVLIFIFVKQKCCSSKLKKLGILNQNSYTEKLGNHTSSETIRELNPQRFVDEIIEKNLVFKSKIDFQQHALGYIHKTFYLSSIISFIVGSIPIYLTLMVRENIIFSILFFTIQIFRFLHLYIVLQGKVIKNIKCTQLNFGIFLYGLIISLIYIIYFIKLDDREKFFFQWVSGSLIFIISLFPCTFIKMSESGNELLVEAISAVGGSSKDQYGNIHSSSATNISKLRVTYPEYLIEEIIKN